ncbi:1,4-dihydroxy-2-naphthoate octaprenyltransferase [Bacillus mesophilus]|uniref:1,4-dihydroxy-2-naphthoate octaprenyltransferase n=1 Tax=Bacillus mesophilus TaxID=1808955 RepID=A0A6M0Q6X0_9BACI|nr:1,4-dihydroxy-2-naphthoate polyprenyltransferase [Bacillus mesophilus]MBM7660425.1 1,4-dihydroxy-2-naphthoate octaprenyltransferase [Bacillus mesophilus]NEY72023.1 1,4-dihydroxy-2-naphthoate polyprenyltransferase [Bacillus mesophilus]
MQTEVNQNANYHPKRHNWRVWWTLTRPHTLTAAFVPVFIGTALALPYTSINVPMFIMMLLACLIIQAATNMINEYYDFKRGLDHEGSVGIGGAIVREGVKPQTVLRLAFILFGVAALIGIYICIQSSWWLAVIGTICMAAGYFYTGGPVPIAYTPFGEAVAGLFMGNIIILLSYFVQAGTITLESVLISMPISILVGAILLANNIRDLDGDQENGRRTLAIIVGRKNAIKVLAGMFIVSYLWVIVLILLNIASPWLLLVLLSIPKPVQATKGFIGKTIPIQMMPAMKATAQTNTIFGLLVSIGLILAYIL